MAIFFRRNRLSSVALLQSIVNGLASSGIYILIALGLSLVMSIIGIIKCPTVRSILMAFGPSERDRTESIYEMGRRRGCIETGFKNNK